MGLVHLIRSISGSGLDSYVQEFVRSYLEEPFRTFLILPNPSVRDEVKCRIIEQGIPVFGASVCTLNELVEYFFDSFDHTDLKLDQYGTDQIIYKILKENIGHLPSFKGDWVTAQTMVPEIKAFLEALCDYQIDYPNCLGDLVSKRTDQLALIQSLYKHYLRSNHRVDRGAMIEWVTVSLSKGDDVRIHRAMFYGLYEPKPIEKDLIRAISGVAKHVDYCLPFLDDTKAFSDDGLWLDPQIIDELGTPEDMGAWNDIQKKGAKKRIEKIVKGVFQDPLEEMRAVAREIAALIASGADPGRIAILLPVRSRSAPLVRQVLEDHGIPFDLRSETPLSESPLIMSLFLVMDAVGSDYDRDTMVRLIRSPFLTFRFEHRGEDTVLGGDEVEEVSLMAGIIGGKDAWHTSIVSLRAQIMDELVDAEDMGSEHRLGQMLEKIERVDIGLSQIFSVLSILEGELTVQERTASLRKILDLFKLLNNLEKDDNTLYEEEVRSLNSFLSALGAMEMGEAIAPSGRMGLREFQSRLRLLTSAEGFHGSDHNTNAVQVSGLRAEYLIRYDHAFIIGMVDGDIPYLAVSNPFIRDGEIERMGLMRMGDSLRQERFYFLSALLSSNVRTYISRPETNGSDMLVPSCFFDDLEAVYDMDTFGDEARECSSLCCQKSVGEMLSKKRELAEVNVDLDVPLEEICQRVSVECEERIKEYDTPYDGVFADVSFIEELNSIMAKRHVYSPSRLESYARCPFRYYLDYILGIEPAQTVETELTPQSRGTLFHRIAYRFYSELREAGNTTFTAVQLDEMNERMRTIGQEELDRYTFQGPAWRAFQDTMLGSDSRKGLLRTFLEKEVTNGSHLCPTYFELSFGLPLDEDEADPSSKREPVEIDLGGEKLKLRCRIDRVDACPDGRFVVLDYKTGSHVPSVSSIEKGTALQLPLYIQAVESAFPEMKGIGGSYYSVRNIADLDHKCIFGDKDHGDELKPYFGERKKLREGFGSIIEQCNRSIASYLDAMRKGRFHPNSGPAKCPRGCEYAMICRVDPSRMEGDDDAE